MDYAHGAGQRDLASSERFEDLTLIGQRPSRRRSKRDRAPRGSSTRSHAVGSPSGRWQGEDGDVAARRQPARGDWDLTRRRLRRPLLARGVVHSPDWRRAGGDCPRITRTAPGHQVTADPSLPLPLRVAICNGFGASARARTYGVVRRRAADLGITPLHHRVETCVDRPASPQRRGAR